MSKPLLVTCRLSRGHKSSAKDLKIGSQLECYSLCFLLGTPLRLGKSEVLRPCSTKFSTKNSSLFKFQPVTALKLCVGSVWSVRAGDAQGRVGHAVGCMQTEFRPL